MASTKEYAQRLFEAKTEEQVIKIIAEFVEENDVEWEPVGGTENNSGIVDIQKGTPVGALAEIIVNGFDAILQKRYESRYSTDYDKTDGLDTYLKAAHHLDANDGTEEVKVIADGPTPRGDTYDQAAPNITVSDTGKGQGYENFSNFIDVMEVGLNKQDIPFSQGMFGMGSHTSVRYCGDDELEGAGFKLIASAHHESPGEWTWTLIRRNPDQHTTFEYLTIDGEFPAFEGTLELSGRDDTIEKEFGTAVKHFNYQMDAKSSITKTAGLRGKLDLELLENPVPINLVETRYDRDVSGVFQSETLGAYKKLKDADVVKHHFEEHLTSRSLPDFLQGTQVDIFLFHDDETLEERDDLPRPKTKNEMKGGGHHQDNTIVFAANGERHASKGTYHVRERADLYNTAKDVKVIVDVSELSGQNLRKIFSPSRDGLNDNDAADKFEDKVVAAVRDNEALREEEMSRRTDTKDEDFEEDMRETLEDMVDRNPQLADMLDLGAQVANTNRGGDTETYTRTEPPTTLRAITTYRPNGENNLWGEGDDEDADQPYEVEMPADRNTWQRFELNAPNGYFAPERDGPDGELEIEPGFVAEEMVEGWGLNNGVLAIELAPHEGATEGMEAPFTVTVTRPNGEPLTEDIRVEFTEPLEESDGTQNSTPQTETATEGLALPEIRLDSFDSEEVVDIYDEGNTEDDGMTILVNEDAESLERYLESHNWKQKGKSAVVEEWKRGMAIYTFAHYLKFKEEYDDQIEAARAAKIAAKGQAPMFLAYHFDDEQIDRLTL